MATIAIPINSRRRDWFKVLRALMRAGVSMGTVARKCNRNVATVSNWADGGEPKESDARVVLALFAKYCPAEYQEHQKAFEVKVEIENLTEPGETRVLPWHE